MRVTRQRRAILESLRSSGRPLLPQEVLDIAREDVPELGLATVYRAIRALEEQEEIVAIHLPGEAPRYELQEVAARHHHHFRCERCDRVFDLPGCADGLRSLLPPGFELHRHDIVLYGLCDECAS
ncbi:MAG: transcriptional repressor [Phycisphaerales bacterium]|nr:transcriptional repressor [Phycisphaerales bacterium]